MSIAWKGTETGNVNDYFIIQNIKADGTFKLVYQGGLTVREDAYNITVTCSDAPNKTATADFALTIKKPTLDLDPTSGSVTVVTKKAVLSQVATSNFTNPVTWSFDLAEEVDITHFSVVNNKLIYTEDGTLSAGEYELSVTASDGIDSVTEKYTFTILENELKIVSLVSSITVNNHDLDVARLVPVNFPEGTIDYSLSWDETADINNYFSVKAGSDRSAYIHYSAGLQKGIYTITAHATGTPTDSNNKEANATSTYILTITEAGVSAEIVLDPVSREMEKTNAVTGYELANVMFNGFDETPVITVSAFNTTAKNSDNDPVLINFDDCFTVTNGKLQIVQNTTTKTLISGEYAITVTAKTMAGQVILQQASATFTLTLYDKAVDTSVTNITIDYDTNNNEFIILDSDNETKPPIDKGAANALVVKVDANTTPIVTITQKAMNNLDVIHVESTQESVLVVQSPKDPTQPAVNHYIISNSSDEYDNPTALTITALDNEKQIARTTSFATKSLTFDSGNVTTQYDINTLAANVQITPSKGGTDIINFSGSTTNNGIVLNLDNTDYFQTVYTGQSGSLKINNTVGELVLSPGNDVVTGSSAGSVITDNTNSWNTIMLQGDTSDTMNTVTLNGGSTIIVNGKAKNNIVINDNGDKTVINMEKASGESRINIKGDQVSITGGQKVKEVALDGDYAILNIPNSNEDVMVHIKGNGSIVKTGSGNDTIYLNGNNSIISLGDGNDLVYVQGTSDKNSISTGAGDDTVIASDTTGGNTIYTNQGNDFIIGGLGKDYIFGDSGNSLLAGGGGADRIIGGAERDIFVANITLSMKDKSAEELLILRNALFNDANPEKSWWNMTSDEIIAILGSKSIADGDVDTLSRQSNSGIDVFFRNLFDEDILNNALDTDLVID